MYEESLKMRHFRALVYPEAELAPLRAAGVGRDGKDEKTDPREAIGSILVVATKAKPKSWLRCL
jgi:hypothetical protein